MGFLLLEACASTPGRQRAEAYRFDTVTNACRQSPANCAALAGKESAGHTVVAAGTRVYAVVRALEALDKQLIEAALVECANLARSEVLLRRRQDFARPSPSREECNQQVKDAAGRRVSRAMQLGTEMHQVVLKCAEERLCQLRPGGFSLEPHYRYDSRSGQTKHIPEEDVAALRESGNQGELLGALVPDVVIHTGNPLHIKGSDKIRSMKQPWENHPRG